MKWILLNNIINRDGIAVMHSKVIYTVQQLNYGSQQPSVGVNPVCSR